MRMIKLSKAYASNNSVHVNIDHITFFYEYSTEGHKCTDIHLLNGGKVSVKESEGAIMDLIND